VADKPVRSDRPTPVPPVPSSDDSGSVELNPRQRAERDRIIQALKACNGNQTRAADYLGMPRRTLVTKLAAYDIPRPRKFTSNAPA
jgi:two-component system, NtrC family, response regulator AtoC